jgi:hypothetical protein
MATSTKWRIDLHALSSAGYVVFYEVAIYNGATNLCTGGTATADSSTGSTPADAFDGNAGTFWQSGTTAAPYPHWIQYEFASAITNPTSYSIKAASSRQPRDWTLSYWDGAAWVVIDAQGAPVPGTAFPPLSWAGNATLTFPLPVIVDGVGAAAGSTTVTGVGVALARGVGTSVGQATVTGVGSSKELVFANAALTIGLPWAELTRPSEMA